MIAPTELWYGRNTVTDSLAQWSHNQEPPSKYAKLLKAKIESISVG